MSVVERAFLENGKVLILPHFSVCAYIICFYSEIMILYKTSIWHVNFAVTCHLVETTSLSPPGIYKGEYLQELYRRYDDINDTPPPPELPDWCKGQYASCWGY